MINNINQTSPFFDLKEFYIPAIHEPISVGKKQMYNLSIPLLGEAVQVKRSSKKIKHASFANVILGAMMRMQKLFQTEKINPSVLINKRPTQADLTLEFELINNHRFIIADEEYIISIVASYSYSKPDKVTYYPILYRQICSNGLVTILNEQFKEIIPSDKILEAGCEWTRCNFESYKNRVNSYFYDLKRSTDSIEKLNILTNKLWNNIFPQNRLERIKENIDYIGSKEKRGISSILSENIEQLGNNQYAVFNAITEYASQEENVTLRRQNFMTIGKYLSREMKKMAKLQKEHWSKSLNWERFNEYYL